MEEKHHIWQRNLTFQFGSKQIWNSTFGKKKSEAEL